MARETDLTSRLPLRGKPRSEGLERRLLRELRRRQPFLFPWSALRSMSGMVISGAGVSLAHGRLDGNWFQVQSATHRSGPDLAGCLMDLGRRYGGPACVSLPRNRSLVRHFRIPAESDSEIEAMLPHLLAGELPQALEEYCWAWSRLPLEEPGYALVAVTIARNDHLEAYLSPVTEAGLNVVTLVPEGWAWAQAIARVGGVEVEGDEPVDQSFVIQRDGAPYLVVARGGRLLFDAVLPVTVWHSTAPHGSGRRAVPLDWHGPGLTDVRRTYEDVLGTPLPPPQILPDISRDLGGNPEPRFAFATAVAALGLAQERPLLPPALQRRSRRRFLRSAAGRLARLGMVAVLLWLGFAAIEDGRARRELHALELELAAQESRVAVLESEHAAIQEHDRQRAAGTEILQAVTSLRHHVPASIALEHLDYVQGQGVTLRGGAPANAVVLEMLDRLATDPLWRHLRVMQLRSEAAQGVENVHFVVEGQLR